MKLKVTITQDENPNILVVTIDGLGKLAKDIVMKVENKHPTQQVKFQFPGLHQKDIN
jgi:hypothetical protein